MEYFFAILIVAIFPNLICETHSERKIEVLCPLSYYTSCRSWYKSESTYSACIICQPLSSYVSSEVEICVANGQLGDSSIEYNKYTCPDINGSNSHEWCKQNLKFGMKVDVTKSNFLLAMESSEGLFDSRSQIPEFACLPDYTMKRVEMRNRFYLEHLNLQTHCIDKIHIGNQSFCVTNHPDFCIVCVQEPYTHSICLSTKSSQLEASTSNLPSLVFKHEDCPYGLLASPVGCSKDVDAIYTLIGEKYVGLRLGPGHNFMFNASNLIRKSSFVYPKKDFYAEEDDVMGYLYYVFYLGTVSFVGIWNAFQTFYILASFVRLKLQKKDKSKISGTAPNVGDEFYYFETEYRL